MAAALTVEFRDPGLPLLAELADPATASGLLGRLLDRPLRVRELAMVKHRPGRRCILRVALEPEPGSPADDHRDLYLKLYSGGRADKVARRTAACAALAACGPRVQIPPVLAVAPALDLVVIGGLGGQPFLDRVAAGQPGLARRMALAMDHLHRIGAPALPAEVFSRHDARRELAPLAARLAALEASGALPAGEAWRAGRAVERALDHAERLPWRWRLLHRDLHPGQVLVDGPRLAVVDWDDAALGEPALDLANFTAHLRLAALMADDPVPSRRLARAADSLAAWGLRLDPRLSRELLRLLEAATLLRLACIHLDRGLGVPRARLLLRRGGRTLSHALEGLTDGDRRG